MYIWIIVLIFAFVWYRRRVSAYDTGVIDKLKVRPLPSQSKPKTPVKTPTRDFTKVKEHPELKKFQRQTAQYKAVAERQNVKEKEILKESAQKIAVERNKANQQVSTIQKQGTNESRQLQAASANEVRGIQKQGTIAAASIKNAANVEAQKIKNAADIDAKRTVTQASLEAVRIVKAGNEEANQIKNKSIPEKYRYVRIIRYKSGGDHWMNIAEVEVYSGGTNVARGKRVTASSLLSGSYPHSNLTDGNRSNFAHTHNGNVEWFLIDLGAEYSINAVVVVNRVDCCQARLRNTKIQLSKYSDMRSPLESHIFTTAEASRSTVTWSPV